jgi:hypothetical protein
MLIIFGLSVSESVPIKGDGLKRTLLLFFHRITTQHPPPPPPNAFEKYPKIIFARSPRNRDKAKEIHVKPSVGY